MLVLRRKKEQRIFITVPPSDKPAEITVLVCHVDNTAARLGFETSREVAIVRDDAIKREGKR